MAKKFDALDKLIASHPKVVKKTDLTPEIAEELLYLSKAAAEGRALHPDTLKEYIKTKYGVDAGRLRLISMIKTSGGIPWFTRG